MPPPCYHVVVGWFLRFPPDVVNLPHMLPLTSGSVCATLDIMMYTDVKQLLADPVRHAAFALVLLFVLYTAFSFASVAFAYTMDVTIDSVHAVDASGNEVVLTNIVLPITVLIKGTVSYDHPAGVRPISLEATVNGEQIYGPEHAFRKTGDTTAHYSIPWTIESVDNLLEVTIRHGADSRTSTSRVSGCRAAPALAAAQLRLLGLSSTNGLYNKRVLPHVAQETGMKGLVWAKYACDENYVTFTSDMVLKLLDE